MKFFIVLFYTAYLLTEITARYWLTTPMQSELRSKPKSDGRRQLAEMIQFINKAFKDKHRNSRRSDGRHGFQSKHHASRRFELPALEVKKRPVSPGPKEDDRETQLEKMSETVRYHVIDNPEVLEHYRNKRNKKDNRERYLMRKKTSSVTIDNQSLEDKYFNTVDDTRKLKKLHKNATLDAGSNNSSNILNTSDIQSPHHKTNPSFESSDGAQELTNIEPTYPPAVANVDKDDGIKLLRITEKENSKPRTGEKKQAVSSKIYKTNKFEKRRGIKARGIKHKVGVDEGNAHADDLNNTGPNKLESQPLHNDNINDQVTKKEVNKEFDYNKNVRMRADDLNPRNNDYSVKIKAEKKKRHTKEDNNYEKDIQSQQTSEEKNKRKHTTTRRITSRKHVKKRNRELKERHLINDQQDRHENSPHQKKRFEKIDHYDTELKKDKDRNDKGNSDKEIDLNNSDNQGFRDGNEYDKMEYEWNKRHLQYDKKEKQGVRNDDERHKKHYDFVKTENNWNKRDKRKNKKGSRILRDGKLIVQESMDSDIEKEED